MNGKYSQKLLHHAKIFATYALKTTSKRVIQKAAKATGDLKNLPQNNSETITNEHDKETPKERYVSPEERQEIIDELRSI